MNGKIIAQAEWGDGSVVLVVEYEPNKCQIMFVGNGRISTHLNITSKRTAIKNFGNLLSLPTSIDEALNEWKFNKE